LVLSDTGGGHAITNGYAGKLSIRGDGVAQFHALDEALRRGHTRAFKQKTTEAGAMADYWSPKQLGDRVDSEFTRWTAVRAKIPAD